ncbi:hypothetical protein LTR64_003202 [Lithohypha guttulata]|uniref:uncharacterized protein n=1 Tax=Lithohypha guttulata TaxID=1690604 RepID=UPI002DDF56B8|nr:hypothetical protein LTR51_000576 [Lithohypha guttulata]
MSTDLHHYPPDYPARTNTFFWHSGSTFYPQAEETILRMSSPKQDEQPSVIMPTPVQDQPFVIDDDENDGDDYVPSDRDDEGPAIDEPSNLLHDITQKPAPKRKRTAKDKDSTSGKPQKKQRAKKIPTLLSIGEQRLPWVMTPPKLPPETAASAASRTAAHYERLRQAEESGRALSPSPQSHPPFHGSRAVPVVNPTTQKAKDKVAALSAALRARADNYTVLLEKGSAVIGKESQAWLETEVANEVAQLARVFEPTINALVQVSGKVPADTGSGPSIQIVADDIGRLFANLEDWEAIEGRKLLLKAKLMAQSLQGMIEDKVKPV